MQNRAGTGPKGDVDVIKEDDRLDAVDCGLAHLHHLRVRGQTICLEHLVGELGIEVLGAGHALEDRTGVQANARMARAGREAIALGEIARARNGAGHLVQAARTALDGQDGTQKAAGVLVNRLVSSSLVGACSITWPAYITVMLWATSATSARSCETKIMQSRAWPEGR